MSFLYVGSLHIFPIVCYDSFVRDLIKIGVSFALTVFIFVAVLIYLPDSYRSNNALAKPSITILKPPPPATNKSICLVGDSLAYLAPWRLPKIAIPGQSTDPLINRIDSFTLPEECRTFIIINGVVLAGTGHSLDDINSENNRIKSSLLKNYPNATVHIIPFQDIREIAKKHTTGDGWHLNENGYRILRSKFSYMFTPPA